VVSHRVVHAAIAVLAVLVLGDPQRSTDDLHARTLGVLKADHLTCVETKLGAIEADVHG